MLSEVSDSESRNESRIESRGESQLEYADAAGSDGLSSYDVEIAGISHGDVGIYIERKYILNGEVELDL